MFPNLSNWGYIVLWFRTHSIKVKPWDHRSGFHLAIILSFLLHVILIFVLTSSLTVFSNYSLPIPLSKGTDSLHACIYTDPSGNWPKCKQNQRRVPSLSQQGHQLSTGSSSWVITLDLGLYITWGNRMCDGRVYFWLGQKHNLAASTALQVNPVLFCYTNGVQSDLFLI